MKSQGKSWDGEKSGNFVMNARNNFFMEVDTLLFLIQVPHMDPGFSNPCICFDAMWYFPLITVSWEENMCLLLTVYWRVIPSIYFDSLINFHLLYCEGKSVTVSFEVLLVFGQWKFKKKSLNLLHCVSLRSQYYSGWLLGIIQATAN